MQKHIYFHQKPLCVLLLISLILPSELNASNYENESGLGTSMIKSPESTDAPPGDECQLQCELNLPPDRVEFRFRPQNSSHDERDRVINIHKMSGYNITTKDRLSKLHVLVNHKTVGDYRCVAWFGASAHTSISAKLRLASISANSKETSKPIIHWKIAPKNSLIIRCGDVVSAPDPSWNYYKNDELLPQENIIQSKNGGYILSNVTANDTGIYSCSAVNTVTSTEIRLAQRYSIIVAATPRSPPTFLLQQATEFSARPGDEIILECPGISNPVSKATWSRPDNSLDLSSDHMTIYGYGLHIRNVRIDDEGTYICRLDNGDVKIHTMRLNVLQLPQIIETPRNSLTNESDRLELNCRAVGSPEPQIYWIINGEDTRFDPLISIQGTRLIISSVEKRHAGIVQCFARNEVGEVNEGALLQVNPKQIDGEGKPIPLGIPHKTSRTKHSHRVTHERKRSKGPNLPSVSKPNITRLDDESVMVKWSVVPSSTDGSLPIQFFKVQYMTIPSDSHRHKGQRQKEDWMTLNEDIPPHLRSYEIHNLKLDHYYKFRISAVYSNNDNKQSPIRKFHMKRVKQSTKASLPIPIDVQVSPVSETEVAVRWSIPENYQNNFGGFYISYRPTTSADEYSIVSAEGAHKRHIVVKYLEPGMNYEIKIQSFTSLTASEFSTIVIGRTMKPTSPPTTTHPTVRPVADDSGQKTLLPIIVGAIAMCAILFLIFLLIFVALKKKREMMNSQREEQASKSNPNHIQIDNVNGLTRSPKHRNNQFNGIRLTHNPLDPLDEKNRLELASLNNNNCLSSQPQNLQNIQNIQNIQELGIPPPPPTHQSSPPMNVQLPPIGPHRKTLERNIRNNHHHNQQHPPMMKSTEMMIDGDLGIPIVRASSIRRQPLRGSNNSINNSPRIVRSHGRHQRSPMPIRASSKRRQHDIERSTASLNSVNSIEV